MKEKNKIVLIQTKRLSVQRGKRMAQPRVWNKYRDQGSIPAGAVYFGRLCP